MPEILECTFLDISNTYRVFRNFWVSHNFCTNMRMQVDSEPWSTMITGFLPNLFWKSFQKFTTLICRSCLMTWWTLKDGAGRMIHVPWASNLYTCIPSHAHLHALGAFTFFGPGKFKDIYMSLNTPASDSHLHFAGGALSIWHAWVEGALNSTWRAVTEMLFKDTLLITGSSATTRSSFSSLMEF